MNLLKRQDSFWDPVPSAGLKKLVNGASVLVTAISAFYASGVSAVEQRSSLPMEEVTVRRRVEKEQDVPISLKAMDTDFLRRQNVVELNDLGTTVPSVRISNAGSSTNEPVVSIRGQRPTDTALSLDQAAPLYFNEVVMTPSIGSNLAMYDLRSVQVLKGPQGTLFGRNSTGGAILITPTRPGVEFGGYAEAQVGDYGLYGFEGAVDLPYSESTKFRLAGRALKRDGYQDNVADNALKGKKKFWDEDSRGLRLSMDFSQGALSNLATVAFDENEMATRRAVPQGYNFSSQIGQIFNYVHNGALGGIGTGPAGGAPVSDAVARQQGRSWQEVESDIDGNEKVENTFFSNITEYELADGLSIKNIFGYRKMRYERILDADGTALPLFGSITSATSPISTDITPEVVESEQYSNELQLIGDALGGDLEWLAGVYWYKMDASQGIGLTQIAGANPYWPQAGTGIAALDSIALQGLTQISPAGDVLNEALSVFGEGTYVFNDAWSITLGLRYSYDEREITAKNYLGNGTVFGDAPGMLNCNVFDEAGVQLSVANCQRTVSEEFEAPTWRTSLNYTPIDGMLLYGGVSTGYRAGGFNLRGTDNQSLQPFDEETVITYELGHKIDWGLVSDFPIRTNLAVFYQEYSDIQKTQAVASATGFGTATINAAEAVIQGVEFDVTYRVMEDLSVSLGYSYIDTGYDSWNIEKPWGPGGTTISVDASDGNFTYIPRNTATLGITYTLPVDEALGEMTFTLAGYWQSEMDTHATPQLFAQQAAVEGWSAQDLATAESLSTADSYDVWNIRFDWREAMGTAFDAALYVKNITDEDYVVGGLNVIDSLGVASATYGPPRTIGASLRYNF